MLESYEHEISFIDLEGLLRICQHLQLLAIRLEFEIKRLIKPSIPIEETRIVNIFILQN
jgi:hypothetical protein